MSVSKLAVLVGSVGLAGCAGLGGASTTLERSAPSARYPSHWWAPVPEREAASWEILPQEAGPGEVILSKRNELGLLSNFAHTPFVFHGQRYASLEDDIRSGFSTFFDEIRSGAYPAPEHCYGMRPGEKDRLEEWLSKER